MNNYNFQYCQKIVVFSKNKDSILLCQRKSEDDYDGIFSFIGGKMEISDKSIIEGLKREKNEEVGESFKIGIYPVFTTNVLFHKKDGSDMILPHYYAVHIEGSVKLNQEYSEYQWVKIDELNSFEPKIPNIPEVVQILIKLKNIISDKDLIII
ncbi:MAG: hypothetical protein COV55_00405 [Candidatus Komeilibacteria bacterium CG11_big_fil_rev_8_21_14_0_20_36_20]|uniref:Nudix hydrolase domain-containing protein n=1 Tax=Candidatus Komeilibacteria bacterium CG11_big_fil_rev_8_21_14_0_20_36_20 TaxID=1974477 RepID=A0A2H0NE68_9BACT|nr:MAG: hypothetical protein COV55_00405 [Candidatus Komeilibacteria bacterium CG11_big_fil_rev_8_21_14_0_20_36_20]PIR81642.1 MAG: hypothetical protein COU21_02250 [Candidatus Komeilibacteria bacterium CG10_big_fil_rev_8_21_14_0_10_36_65]PJC55740.1 MAG: hypothetical protein CO027_00415 [Candidatus Komeilibacteria bacterium CG_4_9_14_0_2_um_filter_36_13]